MPNDFYSPENDYNEKIRQALFRMFKPETAAAKQPVPDQQKEQVGERVGDVIGYPGMEPKNGLLNPGVDYQKEALKRRMEQP